ncbi:MAG: 50S ribosomal protein L4 [Alphaproteobacteria bacterium]|nr:50S ribosomal protein L4 [Alphaproteobacteria bacterium]
MQVEILTLSGKKAGSLELNPGVFGVDVRTDLLARAVNWQRDSQRAGLAFTKTRGEIDRSKKKIYGQKKTGGARHGAKSPSLFVGGGVVFGPRGRDFSSSLPKAVRALALKSALASKAQSQSLIVIDEATMASHKTKELAASLAKLGATNATFIVDALEPNFDRASRNLPHVKVIPTGGANVLDILKREKLVLTKHAVELLTARLLSEKAATAKPAKAAKPAAKAAAPKAEAKAPKAAPAKKLEAKAVTPAKAGASAKTKKEA